MGIMSLHIPMSITTQTIKLVCFTAICIIWHNILHPVDEAEGVTVHIYDVLHAGVTAETE